jgi:hypothetical protein
MWRAHDSPIAFELLCEKLMAVQ